MVEKSLESFALFTGNRQKHPEAFFNRFVKKIGRYFADFHEDNIPTGYGHKGKWRQ